ncbi:flavin monoamine oxidase family protein [Roseimaritima ulvae]|uniref:Protoporphyrinogen oxidase n=1 Tax=Roseimaritima ulvae TaxID=980254 RepID=A0A5B9QKQ7_9BACT|nr:FAD-dependent oxidoreductase [Roseimaritima ulvae]QEG39658.1 protoporphyrinogen oxidase [Roseimaritima ulvae]
MALSRRDVFILLLGTHAATWAGCSRRQLPPAGEMLSPDIASGHRLRDRKLPRVSTGLPATESPDAETVPVVIVGGGIAGLSAAWRLRRAGLKNFRLLELEPHSGGTSRSDRKQGFAYPWGAHYVPAPMKENAALISLLEEMQVMVGRDAAGEPVVAEQYLCRDPEERVFADGRWQEGLYPGGGASDEDLQQLKAFRAAIGSWAGRRDQGDKRMFAIPVATCSTDPQTLALDQISMQTWMDQQGWTSPRLRWLVDHSCRDDYGLTIGQTSAWAGIFYFASRLRNGESESQPVITWPEGNGRIVDYLTSQLGEAVRCSQAVYRIEQPSENQTIVSALDVANDVPVQWRADQVIFAAPQFLVPYIIQDSADRDTASFQYGAWVVANIHLRDRPRETGFPMCWDNVIYGSKSLGYVTSTHQTGADHGPTVLSWYYPLTEQPGKVSRQQLLDLTWDDWAALVVADLELVHPDISTYIERLDVMRWGHAMIQPRPGFVWSDARRDAARPLGNVHFANTDLSGVALMEEAFYHGVRAAEEVLAARRHPFESML